MSDIDMFDKAVCLGHYLEAENRAGARERGSFRVKGWKEKYQRIWGWLRPGSGPPPSSRHKNIAEAAGAALNFGVKCVPKRVEGFRELAADPEAHKKVQNLELLGGMCKEVARRGYVPNDLATIIDHMNAVKHTPRAGRFSRGLGIREMDQEISPRLVRRLILEKMGLQDSLDKDEG